jgi:hypothetical protein
MKWIVNLLFMMTKSAKDIKAGPAWLLVFYILDAIFLDRVAKDYSTGILRDILGNKETASE